MTTQSELLASYEDCKCPDNPVRCFSDRVLVVFTALAAEIRRLQAENDGLRVDAERYRWLRGQNQWDKINPAQLYTITSSEENLVWVELDAAIDEARKAR